MKILKQIVYALSLFTVFELNAQTTFKVSANHPDCVYTCGQETTFTVWANTRADKETKLAKTGQVKLVLDNFGEHVFAERTIDLAKENPFTVKGVLKEPGFLRLTLTGENCQRKVYSAAYDPTRIEKGSPSPADFDAFWADARAKLRREVPLDAKVVRIAKRSTKAFDFYRISFATFGRRVHGYMSVPTDHTKAPYPVDFQVAAAGFGGWTNNMGGKPDAINVFFSVYPFEPNWQWDKLGLKATTYDAMNDAYMKEWKVIYSCAGITKSCEDYFFYPVLLGIDRAVDWVAARPDVDKTRFRYQGTSQGGGFGFYLTGLNHTFTRAAFYVPAITDTMGYLKSRQSGWPRIVESNSSTPALRAAAERNAPYFDGANFASRIRCPVRVAVGFSDTTCPPCAVYAAYNAIPVKDKGIVHGIDMTHSCYGKFYQQLGHWVVNGR